jgi:hypothetical protein
MEEECPFPTTSCVRCNRASVYRPGALARFVLRVLQNRDSVSRPAALVGSRLIAPDQRALAARNPTESPRIRRDLMAPGRSAEGAEPTR